MGGSASKLRLYQHREADNDLDATVTAGEVTFVFDCGGESGTALSFISEMVRRYGLQDDRVSSDKDLDDIRLYIRMPKNMKFKDLLRTVSGDWCAWVRQHRCDTWFTMNESVMPWLSNNSIYVFKIKHYSSGAMVSRCAFTTRWKVPHKGNEVSSISAEFDVNEEVLTIKNEIDQRNFILLEIPYESLYEKVLVDHDVESNTWTIRFMLRFNPKIIRRTEKPRRRNIPDLLAFGWDDDDDEDDTWKEDIRLTNLEEIGVKHRVDIISVLAVQTDSKEALVTLNYLRTLGFDVAFTHIFETQLDQDDLFLIERLFTDNFKLTYSWHCLLSHGPKVKYSIRQNFATVWQIIESNLQRLSPDVFYAMSNDAKEHLIFDFVSLFHANLGKVEKGECQDSLDLPNRRYFGRVVLTPSCQIMLPPDPVEMNRVLRGYHRDHLFLRVCIRDEDFTKLSEQSKGYLENVLKNTKQFFVNGVRIGQYFFEFLGCSNSQLREHGFWFCSVADDKRASDIRQELGDLRHERCVAKYVSRLGQCFSSSSTTIDTRQETKCTVVYTEDEKVGTYCMTDGIGRISKPVAHKVQAEMNLSVLPSAFQIRYGGCKGVLAVDESLKDKEMIIFRESMNKFQSNATELEINAYSKPGQYHLNRQIITLMSGLGVEDHNFLSLQEEMLTRLARMFLYEDEALMALERYVSSEATSKRDVSINFKELHANGISFTDDPFFDSVLLTVYRSKVYDLKGKARIEIPEDSGRILMGTTDESKQLKYGEVFIQYSENVQEPQKRTTVLIGKVVIAKNPCFHPGDLRIFDAVDIKELHHMVDCVVFPQCGPRSHPDEMSGSDLDGDMYHACWLPQLFPPKCNEKPMEFPKNPAKEVDGEIKMDDIADFLMDYIKANQLGRIANAHVVHADNKGIFSNECLELAKLHSDAVDFPKTGIVPDIGKELQVKRCPHFMMKKDKGKYTSKNVLGKLFDECLMIDRMYGPRSLAKPKVSCNPCFKFEGYQKYYSQALELKKRYDEEVRRLMNFYGIESEAEVLTGMIRQLKKTRGWVNIDKEDKLEIGNIVRQSLLEHRQKLRQEFFREFQEIDSKSKITKHDDEDVLAKASACFVVTYDRRSELLSFPWAVVSDLLILVRTATFQKISSTDGRSLQDPRLSAIGRSLVEDVRSSEKKWLSAIQVLAKEERTNLGRLKMQLQYIRTYLESNPVLIPAFLYITKWGNVAELHVTSRDRKRIFPEIDFYLIVVHVLLDELGQHPKKDTSANRTQQSDMYQPLTFNRNAVTEDAVATLVFNFFPAAERHGKKHKENYCFRFYDPSTPRQLRQFVLDASRTRALSYSLKKAFHDMARWKSIDCDDGARMIDEKLKLPDNVGVMCKQAEPFIVCKTLCTLGVQVFIHQTGNVRRGFQWNLAMKGTKKQLAILHSKIEDMGHLPSAIVRDGKVIFEDTRHDKRLKIEELSEHFLKCVQTVNEGYSPVFHGEMILEISCVRQTVLTVNDVFLQILSLRNLTRADQSPVQIDEEKFRSTVEGLFGFKMKRLWYEVHIQKGGIVHLDEMQRLAEYVFPSICWMNFRINSEANDLETRATITSERKLYPSDFNESNWKGQLLDFKDKMFEDLDDNGLLISESHGSKIREITRVQELTYETKHKYLDVDVDLIARTVTTYSGNQDIRAVKCKQSTLLFRSKIQKSLEEDDVEAATDVITCLVVDMRDLTDKCRRPPENHPARVFSVDPFFFD